MVKEIIDDLNQCINFIRTQSKLAPEIGLILGTGFGFLTDNITDSVQINYVDLPGFPVSTVEGHEGKLVLGILEGRKVVVMQGRIHFYEGYPINRIVMGVRLMGLLGIRVLIVTCTAGGIGEDMNVGDLMLICDHINLMGTNPLIGSNVRALGPRFLDLSNAYNKELRYQARGLADELGIELKQGVYAALTGPSFETPAEARLLKIAGAHAAGMSVVPEVITARHMDINVLGIACITNLAPGVGPTPISHDRVIAMAYECSKDLSRLIHTFVARIHCART